MDGKTKRPAAFSDDALEKVIGGTGDASPTDSAGVPPLPFSGPDAGTIDDKSLDNIRAVSEIVNSFTSQPIHISREV